VKSQRTDLPGRSSRATAVTIAVVACLLLVAGAGATGSTGSSPSFAAGPPLPLGPTPFTAVVGDFDRNGSPDVAVANQNGYLSDVRVLLNDGGGRFRVATGSPFRADNDFNSLVAADFNNDGKLDLAIASDSVRIFLGDGTGRFNSGSLVQLGVSSGSLLTADLNSDGRPDLVAVTRSESSGLKLALLINDGAAGFALREGPPITRRPDGVSVALADFDGDARKDLVLAQNNSSDLSMFPGDGAGGFGSAVLVPAGSSPGDVQTSDFDADGHVDLAVSTTAGLKVLLGDGTGSFRPGPGSPLKNVAAPAIADLNGDRKPDLAYPDGETYSGAAVVQLGDGTGRFSPAPLSPFYAGWPGMLVAADFNADGRADLLPLAWDITWGPAPRGNMILFQTPPTPDVVPGRSLASKADSTFATKQSIWNLVADGKRAAFESGCSKRPLRVWTAPARTSTGIEADCDAIGDLAIAGKRVAFIEYWFGNTERSYGVFVASAAGGRAREVDTSGEEGLEMENSEDVFGPWVGALVGGASVLAYNSWWVDCVPPPCDEECENEGGGGGCSDGNPTLRVEGQQLWRIGERRSVAVKGGRRAYPVRAAGGGRMAVEPATGVVVLRANGSRVSMVPAQKDDPPRDIALGRTHLALLRTFTLDVYDPATGARQRSIALGPAAGLELAGVNSTVALLRGAAHLVLVRLSDGKLISFPLRAAAVDGFVDAKLTGAGLFYAYNLKRGAKRGHVVFEPLAKLLARF
jgi:hypothetical protein